MYNAKFILHSPPPTEPSYLNPSPPPLKKQPHSLRKTSPRLPLGAVPTSKPHRTLQTRHPTKASGKNALPAHPGPLISRPPAPEPRRTHSDSPHPCLVRAQLDIHCPDFFASVRSPTTTHGAPRILAVGRKRDAMWDAMRGVRR